MLITQWTTLILSLFVLISYIPKTSFGLKDRGSVNERKLALLMKKKRVIYSLKEIDPSYIPEDSEVDFDKAPNGRKSPHKHKRRKRQGKKSKSVQRKISHLEEPEHLMLDYEGYVPLRPKVGLITEDPYDSLLPYLPEVDADELEPRSDKVTTRRTTTITTQASTKSTSIPTTSKMTTKFSTIAPSSSTQKTSPTLTPSHTKKPIKISLGSKNLNKNSPVVHTLKGKFRGRIIKMNNMEVRAFLGIPYSAPPTNNRRFKIPFPPSPAPSDSIMDASELKPRCYPTKFDQNFNSDSIQDRNSSNNSSQSPNMTNSQFSEDCLYINIWVPHSNGTAQKQKPLPVLAFIHGQDFLNGVNDADYETIIKYSAMTNVIVVVIQYRQGVFGFAYVGTIDAPGNVGLLDQIQALQWIDENIEFFGGNPSSITLMGHGLGAAFVGFHLISKISPSFFKRAILIGGAPTQPHVFKSSDIVYNATVKFSMELGCQDFQTPQTLVECLISLDSETIWGLQTLFYSSVLAFPFVPTSDGFVLEDSPLRLLERRRGKTGKVLIGVAENAGSIMLLKSVEGILRNKPTFISYDKLVLVMTHLFRRFNRVEREFILHQYKNWNYLEDGYANQQKISDAITDHYFICPLRQFADLWSARGLETNFFMLSQDPVWAEGVHGKDSDYIFGVPIRFPSNHSDDQVKLSQVLLKITDYFMKTGTVANGWIRYGWETPSYVHFKAGKLPPVNYFGPRAKECSFWNELFPELRMI